VLFDAVEKLVTDGTPVPVVASYGMLRLGIGPTTGEVVELFHPRTDVWVYNLRIHNGEVHGLSPAGRATVRLLQMNSRRRVDLRRDLHGQGLRPTEIACEGQPGDADSDFGEKMPTGDSHSAGS
jgi:hypothetical protein